MDATDIDFATWQIFRTKLGVDIGTTIVSTRTVMDSLIAASAAKQDGLARFAALLAPESFETLIEYGIANSYVPVGDPPEDAFLLSQLKVVADLRARDAAIVAELAAKQEEAHAADYTYALMAFEVGSKSFATLMDFIDDQEWYNPADNPSEAVYLTTRTAMVALINAQAEAARTAIFNLAGTMQAEADSLSDLADVIEAITWTEFEDYIASL